MFGPGRQASLIVTIVSCEPSRGVVIGKHIAGVHGSKPTDGVDDRNYAQQFTGQQLSQSGRRVCEFSWNGMRFVDDRSATDRSI